MKDFARRLEVAANVAILVVAVGVAGMLVKTAFGDPGGTAAHEAHARPEVVEGTKVSIPDVDWARNGNTLLMFLSENCHFCTESAPFYARLSGDVAKQAGVKIVAVLPQPVADGERYVRGLGVEPDKVVRAPIGELGVLGTPTLILVDATGTTKHVWRGKLPEAEENALVGELRDAACAGCGP